MAATDLFASLGGDLAREFADRRDTLPRALIWDEEAPRLLAEAVGLLVAGRRATVLCDDRTVEVGGRDLLRALAACGWKVEELRVPDGPAGRAPVCDDHTRDALAARLPASDLLFAAGSGVVNDLCKWLAAGAGVPYAVLATAASMNGYTAANVAPSIRGVKSLVRARAPLLLAARPSVIEGAPFRLTSSGLGDVIAKPVSTADWLLNHRLFGEAFSSGVARIIDRVEPLYLERPEALAAREPSAVRALFDALVLSGCAMTLQGSSLPASGGEHLISHTLDMRSHVDGVPHDLHGRQVGVATIVAAALYQRVLARPARFTPRAAPLDRGWWGGLADAVEVEHRKKEKAAPGRWEAIGAELRAQLRQPAAIKSCLARAGAAHRFADLGIGRDRFLEALLHAGGMRGRFTSLDLAWVTGVLPDQAAAVVDEWVA